MYFKPMTVILMGLALSDFASAAPKKTPTMGGGTPGNRPASTGDLNARPANSGGVSPGAAQGPLPGAAAVGIPPGQNPSASPATGPTTTPGSVEVNRNPNNVIVPGPNYVMPSSDGLPHPALRGSQPPGSQPPGSVVPSQQPNYLTDMNNLLGQGRGPAPGG
ncbi:Hypothetical protein D9617_7g030220 [Elsinoe fawcettii]|nr:Hypothetical protein D9617_7g030220 [Elsinoe fawcettii]